MEKVMKFPIFKTKKRGPKFHLTDPKDRKAYFELKAGPEIKKLKEFLKRHAIKNIVIGKVIKLKTIL